MEIATDLWRVLYRQSPHQDEVSAGAMPPWYAPQPAPQRTEEPLFREDLVGPTPRVPDPERAPGVQDDQDVAEEQRVKARVAVAEQGIEALAWYSPIHYSREELWGIWFHEPLFLGWARAAYHDLNRPEWITLRDDLIRAVLRHEYFHAAVELFCLVLEDFAGAGAEVSSPDVEADSNGRLDRSAYRAYTSSVYVPTLAAGGCVEESLASAMEFGETFRTAGLHEWLAAEHDRSPASYRKWTLYADEKGRLKGMEELLDSAMDCIAPRHRAMRCLRAVNANMAVRYWFPSEEPAQLDVFARTIDGSGRGIPIRAWNPGFNRTTLFLPRSLWNLPRDKFLRFLARRYDAIVARGHSGPHPKIVIRGRSLACPEREPLPHYVAKQVAETLGITWTALLEEFERG